MNDTILITGGNGFVGSVLVENLLAKGHNVVRVSRHPPEIRAGVALVGDILKPDLGLTPGEIDKGVLNASSCFHLAAIHRLGDDKDGSIWETNVGGTKNVIEFCVRYNIPHLLFCSTAYTEGRNVYERSKAVCELMLRHCDIPEVTVFKPSVVMGTESHPYPGHFSQFVSALIRTHRRAELVRRKVEGVLRLPVLEPVFRVIGDPDGTLNLIPVETVAGAMATIKAAGTFWLTNPSPPTLGDLAKWVGEFIMVDFRIMREFDPTPLEAHFRRMASAFIPYLEGDSLASDLIECPAISRAFIHDTVKRTLALT